MATTLSSTGFSEKISLKQILLTCGILSSLYYIAINIWVAMQYEGYNAASQTVSELSAIGTPTRSLWVSLVTVYSVLVMAFGWGVLKAANKNGKLRLAGWLLIVYIGVGIIWPPMHQREALAAGAGSLTDTLHIVWTLITVPLMLLIMVLSAATFGKLFRMYTIITIIVQLGFGVLTGLDSPKMEANLPTPWMGVWERISMAAFMIWLMVFATMLLRMEKLNHRRAA